MKKLDWEHFKEKINAGGYVRLYHSTSSKETANGLADVGFDREYIAKNSAIYGTGAYTTFNLKSAINNSINQDVYGKVIVEAALIGGFKNFLIFDESINDKFNNSLPMEEQLKNLLPENIFERVKNSSSFNYICKPEREKTMQAYGHGMGYRTAGKLSALLDLIAPKKYSAEYEKSLRTDELLVKTKIRGYVLRGNNDGDVCVVRDFKSLIPIRVTFDFGKTWKNLINEERFNNITNLVDAVYTYRNRYPETPANEKAINGFMRVKKDGKYNYVNTSDDTELLPVWADNAYPFDASSKKARFSINGKDFTTDGIRVFGSFGEPMDFSEIQNYVNNNNSKESDDFEDLDIDSLFETIVKETISESLLTEVIHQSFEDFSNDLQSKDKHLVHLYHCTSDAGLKGILHGGNDPECRGGEAIGRGVYTSYSIDSAIHNRREYGGNIVEMILYGGYKNFLFYTSKMNEKYNGGKPLEQQYKELLPSSIFEKLCRHKDFKYCCRMDNGAESLKKFFSLLLSVTNESDYYFNSQVSVEKILMKTKIRGWVVDYWCGKSVVIRNYKELIPIKFSKDGKNFTDCLTKENFDLIASLEDASVKYGGKYPETYPNEKVVNGFIRVKKDGKYNYVNTSDDTELLPVWADNAYPFDASSKKAKFTLNGKDFTTDGIRMFGSFGEPMDFSELTNIANGNNSEISDDFDNLDLDSLFENVEETEALDDFNLFSFDSSNSENDNFVTDNEDDNSQFVDLGLPSGKLWMKHLLGMESDTDIHNAIYFQWGSKKGYRRREKFNFTKENCDYNKTKWDLFGDNVKLPTKDDFQELLDNTKQKREIIDGVKGMRFISKNNGNSIFVPFIGCRGGSNVSLVGDLVNLWSSSLFVSYPDLAVGLSAYSSGDAYVYNLSRYYGFGVLGVLN